MSLLNISAFTPPTTAGSGFRIALRETKVAQFIQITITESAQVEHFGRKLREGDEVKVMIDNAAGRNHLMGLQITSEGKGVIPAKGMKGSVRLKLQPWRQVPKGKLPITSMVLVSSADGGALLRLPDWAKPDPKAA